MSVAPEIAAATAAWQAGRLCESAALLRPLAEAGHLEAQAHLGFLMMHGFHRFATSQEMNEWRSWATAAELEAFQRELESDIEQAMRWLQNASDGGFGAASHNLAMAYGSGWGDLPSAERRAKVKELLARARSQGFAFFGGPEKDEEYLQTLEGYAADREIGMPWE